MFIDKVYQPTVKEKGMMEGRYFLFKFPENIRGKKRYVGA